MLQLQVLRQDPQAVKERLAIKHFGQPELVDQVIALDDERKKLQLESDNLQAKINSASKEIGQLMGKGQKEEAEKKKQEVASFKSMQQPFADKLAATEKQLNDKLVLLPNLPSPQVPPGKTPADNVVVREGGTKPQLPAGSVPHWDLIKKYDIVDFETGAKITGSGFPLYKGKGAKLQRALIRYFLDVNTEAGYTEYIPPFMVNETSAYGTGQLPDKEGQMYHMPEDGFYMIPTSEVPLTNIYRDDILKEEVLPIKMTAHSPCFRREAGSFGKDVRGLNRVHQFEKVEIVQLVHPDKSYKALDEMVLHVEKLLNSLELPYRILRLCGGDMSFASAITYDFEVYSAAQEKWLEVSSVSNFETFQANRMKIRFRDTDGKTKLVHSLNGSSLALPRIVACLLENNQTAEGVKLPAVLHSYFGKGAITSSQITKQEKQLLAISKLADAFGSLKKADIMHSQLVIYEIGKWLTAELLGGVRSSNTQAKWDVQVGDKKIDVKSHLKSNTNNIRWTEIKANQIKNITELVIIVFSENLKVYDFFQIPVSYLETLVNNKKVVKIRWDEISNYNQKQLLLDNKELEEILYKF